MAREASAPEGGPPDRPATIYTVAEAAGVSHQTVSRYLKGASLRPGNRERVEQAVKALDYQVNDVAQALSTKKSHRIGAFVFDIDDWAPPRILAGAAKAARSAGYILGILRVDPEDNVSLRNAVRLMNRTMLAGVVVISPSDPILRLLQLERLRVPWVVEAEPVLGPDDDRALQHPFARVVSHLADLGHERFFHIGGPVSWLAERNRREAYRQTLARRGLTNCGETQGLWGAAAGYEAMASYPHADAPTAIVAASDQLAPVTFGPSRRPAPGKSHVDHSPRPAPPAVRRCLLPGVSAEPRARPRPDERGSLQRDPRRRVGVVHLGAPERGVRPRVAAARARRRPCPGNRRDPGDALLCGSAVAVADLPRDRGRGRHGPAPGPRLHRRASDWFAAPPPVWSSEPQRSPWPSPRWAPRPVREQRPIRS